MDKNIKDLLRLVQENPDVPVMAIVNSEIATDYDYRYWLGSIGMVELSEYCVFYDAIYTDRDNFTYHYLDERQEVFEKMSVGAIAKILAEIADEYFKPAILVYIEA